MDIRWQNHITKFLAQHMSYQNNVKTWKLAIFGIFPKQIQHHKCLYIIISYLLEKTKSNQLE